MFEGEEVPDEKSKEGQPEFAIDKDDNLLRVWFNFILSVSIDTALMITLCLQTVLSEGLLSNTSPDEICNTFQLPVDQLWHLK